MFLFLCFFFFQAEDGIRDLVRSRGLGDVYKKQHEARQADVGFEILVVGRSDDFGLHGALEIGDFFGCLLYTSDAADERSSVDLGGRRIIKKKKTPVQQAVLVSNRNVVMT